MPLKIISIAPNNNQAIAVTPLVTRLFHEVGETISGVSTYKINVNEFLNDAGEVVENLPVLNLNNHYFHIYVNGVLQMDDSFAYTAGEQGIGSLIMSIPEETEIPAGTPVIMEIINFYPQM
ncbi:DUF4183 domain-containing protein [Lysinibacillus sp. 3P01SB]|uniref:DUF4183 domain-containing protein n=1 Tax=Lysinibacillus sp. 3P01SB TaxID=3132284 RepID=UPI0039A4AABF